MKVHVGRVGLSGDPKKYAKHFNFCELSAEPGHLPKAARLGAWADELGEEFVFSVALSRQLASLEPFDGRDAQLAYAIRVARVVRARWLLIRTPPAATPGARTRRRLRELVEALPKGEFQVAWEPRGLWEEAQEETAGAEVGVTLVRDLTRRDAAPGPLIYCRLLAFSETARVSRAGAERVALRLMQSHASEACIVVEGRDAVLGAKTIRSVILDEQQWAEEDGEDGSSEEEGDEDELPGEFEDSEP
jgi:uncharacterized protein YecE (DUF72 family)